MGFPASFNEKAVEYLLTLKPKINAQDAQGTTALMIAAGAGNTKIVKTLLNAKANVNVRDAEGRTARNYAINNLEILKLIIAQEEENTRAPLYTWEEQRQNLENRSRQDVTTSQLADYLAYMERIENPTQEQQETMKYMREELEPRTTGITALMWAANHGRTDIIRQLLASAADIEPQNLNNQPQP